MTCVMQLICQGETLANRNSRFPFDDPLTEVSQKQAQELKGCFGPFSKTWTAPDQAACQTSRELGFLSESVWELAEAGYGRWKGVSIKKVIEQDYGTFQCWLSGEAPPEGEKIAQVMARTGIWLSRRVSDRGIHCAVASSTVIRAIVIQILDAPASSLQLIDILPLSTTLLRSDGKRWHVVSLGNN